MGLLAESWELPTDDTILVKLREGIRWHDKPPVNGRELTSEDIAYHYDRICGTGHGFTETAPRWRGRTGDLAQITAIDRYTVELKFAGPVAWRMGIIGEQAGLNEIEAREAVEAEGGSLVDWRQAVGTGPFMLTDFVADSSITYTKNPNYWGYDERHPDNKLPYIDEFRILIIADTAAALSAVRTGKIDIMPNVSWLHAENLATTNSELMQAARLHGGYTAQFRVDLEPYNNLNVRKAFQMSINRPEIATSYYGGTVDGTPAGNMSPLFTDIAHLYADWSDELKAEYSYNPTRAIELLEGEGYTADPVTGIRLETHIHSGSANDLDLLEILKDYLLDIGVDMDIIVIDQATAFPFAMAGNNDQLWWNGAGRCGAVYSPQVALGQYTAGEMANFAHVDDADYMALVNAFNSTGDVDVAKDLLGQVDQMALENHWNWNVFPHNFYTIYQPYIKGYSGEGAGFGVPGTHPAGFIARFWVDSALKASMGR
jgi:peptide/nickel transport system substrate-binding protein